MTPWSLTESRVEYQQPASLPMPFRLAVEACRCALSPVARRITLEPSDRDWDQFVHLCRRHRIQGVALRGLASGRIEPRADVHETLSADARDIAMEALQSSRCAKTLSDAFEDGGIAHLFVKGLTLSALAYGDPFAKMSRDVDVLVGLRDIERAAMVMTELGFRCVEPARGSILGWHQRRKESVWIDRDGVIVELHSRLADNPRIIPDIGMQSDTQMVTITRAIRLRTLADEPLLIYLAVHGASSAWFRLKWLADFAALLELRDIDDLEKLAGYSDRMGAGRTFAQALLLSRMLFGTPLGKSLERAIDTRANQTFAQLALSEMLNLREPLDRPLGTVGIHAAQLLAAPGAGFAFSEIARQARTALRRR